MTGILSGSELSELSDSSNSEMDVVPKELTRDREESELSDSSDSKMSAVPETSKRGREESKLSDPSDVEMSAVTKEAKKSPLRKGSKTRNHLRKRPRLSGTHENPINVELSVSLWEHRATPDFVRIFYFSVFLTGSQYFGR